MSVQSLQQEVEAQLDVIDPVGAKLRKLKRRLAFLNKKGSVSTKEYKEISNGWPKVKELERQRQELINLETNIDRKNAKLMRLSKNFDKVTEQYESGKIDPDIYEHTLRKLYANLASAPSSEGPATTILINGGSMPLGYAVSHTLQQGCMAIIVIFILIPALFSCHFV